MNLRQLSKVGRIFLRNKSPLYLIQYITSQCNSRCKMCFYWDSIKDEKSKKEILRVDEFEKISKGFGRLLQLSLTGGEPFLRNDIAEICKIFVKNTDPLVVTIPTNGLLPDKIASEVQKILNSCKNTFFRFSLSLDGIGKNHDDIRGVDGNFEKFIESYKKLRSLKKNFSNFNIDIGTVISKYNQDSIPGIFKFVEDNLEIDNHYFALARGKTRLDAAKEIDLINYQKMIHIKRNQNKRKERRPFSRIFREVFELNTEILLKTLEKKRMIIPCVAGKNMVIISETGDVYPCEILSKKLGNIKSYDYSINKILHSDAAKSILKFIKEKKCYCSFECAINASIIFNKAMYPRIFWNIIKAKNKTNDNLFVKR